MMMERRLKILMIGGVTLLCGFIVAGNIHDPGTNLLFVQHVFSMDTIVPVSAMADHALSIPLLWRIGSLADRHGEGLTAALFALGAVELFRARNGNARDFHQAKRFVFAGAGCVICCSGLSAFSLLGANGSRCGNRRSGTVRPAAFRFIKASILSCSDLRRAAGRRQSAFRLLVLIMRTEARSLRP